MNKKKRKDFCDQFWREFCDFCENFTCMTLSVAFKIILSPRFDYAPSLNKPPLKSFCFQISPRAFNRSFTVLDVINSVFVEFYFPKILITKKSWQICENWSQKWVACIQVTRKKITRTCERT